MTSLLQDIQQEIHLRSTSKGKTPKDLKYLLAVSGGMDSMAMLHAFMTLDLEIGVAHFNFKLRGEESDLDQQLIEDFCQQHQIPVYITSENTKAYAERHKTSIQVAARELRYQFFTEIANQHGFDYICTAHHGHDQLETFFINLFRGSGLKGLTGIPQLRGQIFRPMLWIPRHKIVHYVNMNSVPFREDATNQSDQYLRNQIRHHIINPLTSSNPVYLKKSLNSIAILSDYQTYIDSQLLLFREQIEWEFPHSVQNITLIQKAKETFNQPFLLKLYLLEKGLYPDSIKNFLDPEAPRKSGSLYPGQDVEMWYDRGQMWIINKAFYHSWSVDDRIEIPLNKKIELPGGDHIQILPYSNAGPSGSTWNVPVSIEKVKLPLYARHRQPGDFLWMGSPPYFRKSLKKLLIEKRIPLPFKDRCYVIVDDSNHVISVPGITSSSRFSENASGYPSGYILEYESILLDIFSTI